MDKKIKIIMVASAIILTLIIIMFFAVRTILYGEVTVAIEGPHDPTITRVVVGDVTLVPSGEGGRVYKYFGKTGEYSLVVYGPTTLRLEETVSIESNRENYIEVSPNRLTERDIASLVLPEIDKTKIIDSNIYGIDKNWLVVKASSNSKTEVFNFYVLTFSDGSWEVIDTGSKINSLDEKYQNAPLDLVNYLELQAGD